MVDRAQSKKNPQQRILLAASRAQRKIHIIYLVLVLIFAAALAYLIVRVSISLIEAPESVQLETTPVEVRQRSDAAQQQPTEPLPQGGAIAQADISRLDDARDAGFRVLQAHDVRTEADIERGEAGTEELDEQAITRFRELLQRAERMLERTYDYTGAVRQFEAALALSGVPYYEREIAIDGLDRAQVFHTVVSGATPIEQRHRVVRYTPPEADAADSAIFALVSRDLRNWRGPGRIRIQLIDTDAITEIRVTSEWQVEELGGDALLEAKAMRVHNLMATLQRLREEGLLGPTDLLEVGVLILETGEFKVPGGDPIYFRELAHACLSQAYDLSIESGTSLTETVLLRRDRMFHEFIRLQSEMISVAQQLPQASGARRRQLEQRQTQILTRSRESLTTLVRRYPQAWDFRHIKDIEDAEAMLERFTNEALEQAEREAEALAGDNERASEPPEDSGRDEQLTYLIERGESHLERGYEATRRARGGELSANAVQDAYAEAVEQFFVARDYFRRARDMDPTNEYVADKIRIANMEIRATRNEMSLRR